MLRKMIGLALLIVLVAAPAAAHAQDDIGWLLGQINGLRASVGLPGYALNAQLSAAAAQHSAYMATNCTISHTESNGSRAPDRARANGYTGDWISENIYGGTIATAADAWNFWLNSAVHYQGMVNPNTNEIGIGVASSECGNYFTLVFGHRPDVTAPPAPILPAEVSPAEQPALSTENPPLPPPTAVPYVPPPPTRTPTPTILTLTPSATWTITPTDTPSPTGTLIPPTPTALILPTVPAPDQAVAVALAPSASPVPPGLGPVAEPSASGGGIQARDLIPIALIAQVILIGVAGFMYFRRSR